MPLHPSDFGKDVIPVLEGDIFFLDTNVIVAVLFHIDLFHNPATLFVHYLMFRSVTLITSHTVITEAMHILAKNFYSQDQLLLKGGRLSTHRANWNKVLKTEPEELAKYNQIACEKLADLLKEVEVVSGDDLDFVDAMERCVSIPMGSADAFIATTACNLMQGGVTRIVSLDRDMEKVPELEVYSTEVQNGFFEADRLIEMLGQDFEKFLMDAIGPERFQEKYRSGNGVQIIPFRTS